MTRGEALAEADRLLDGLIRSGDEAIYKAARLPDGSVDQEALVAAALRARERLADKLMGVPAGVRSK
jgi:hypothetical protein